MKSSIVRRMTVKATQIKKPFPSLFPFIATLSLPIGGYLYYSSMTPLQCQALNPAEFIPFTLKEIISVNHNTKTFRFALPEGSTDLGLPVASCLVTKFLGTKADGTPDTVIRPYTPVVDESTPQVFDLVVKKYLNGPMSTHIHSLKVGDTLEMKGPIQKFKYFANEFKEVGMIAAGTGITPMLQVLERIIKNDKDTTRVSLVFANIEERDILLKEQLDALAVAHPLKFRVHYVLERPPTTWTQGTGFIGESQLKEFMPLPTKGKVFICGPTPMYIALSGDKNPDKSQGELGGLLKKMGYSEADVYKF